MKDYFSSLFYYAEQNNIFIDRQEFNSQIINHPDYPSLLAVLDTISHFDVKYQTFSLEEMADNLPRDFLAIVRLTENDSTIAYIQNNKDGYFILKNDVLSKLSSDDFNRISLGIIITLIQNETPKLEKQNKWNINFIPITLLFLILIFLIIKQPQKVSLMLTLLTLQLIGLGILILDFIQSQPLFQIINRKICNVAHCDQITSSSGPTICNIFNFQFWGLMFFIFQPLTILIFVSIGQYMAIFPLLFWAFVFTIPIIGFSIYCQFALLKSMCRKCLIITLLIIVQAIIISQFSSIMIQVSLNLIIVMAISFIISWLGAIFINQISKLTQTSSEINVKYFRFKRNFYLFYNTLLKSKYYDTTQLDYYGARIGAEKPALKLYLITNPHCYHCRRYFNIIKGLEQKFKDKVAIIICFLINIKDDKPEFVDTCRRLIYSYSSLNTKIFLENLDYIENALEKINNLTLPNNTEFPDENLAEIYKWCISNEIYYTPTLIIDSFELPNMYEFEDVKYFIDDLIDVKIIS